MQHFLSHTQLLTVNYFHKKSSIIDIRQSSKYASDKLSLSSYSKVNVFLQIAIFRFARRNPYTAHNVGKTIHCKTENNIGKYYHLYSQKNSFDRFSLQQFWIFMNDNIEYLQVLIVQRRFCQMQINSSVMASLYIYKLKINGKLQEKTLARWDMLIYHVPTVSCVNLQS